MVHSADGSVDLFSPSIIFARSSDEMKMQTSNTNADWGDFTSPSSSLSTLVRSDGTTSSALPGIFGAYAQRSTPSSVQSLTRHPTQPSAFQRVKTNDLFSLQRHATSPPASTGKRVSESMSAASSFSSRLSVGDGESTNSLSKTASARHQPAMKHSMDSCPSKIVTARARSNLSLRSPCPSTKSCMESYRLFQRCNSGAADLSNISCGAAVASYMKCAFDQC